MKTKKLIMLASLASSSITVSSAQATDVEVHIQNLSSESIYTSSSGFPSSLAPGRSESVFLNFPNHTSMLSATYRAASGKTCNFTASHRHYGGNTTKWDKAATAAEAGKSNCGVVLNVRRYSTPFHYRVGFHMTD